MSAIHAEKALLPSTKKKVETLKEPSLNHQLIKGQRLHKPKETPKEKNE